MASISLILILITVNVQFSDSNCQDTNVATNLDNVNNNVKNNNNNLNLNSLHNNVSNYEYKSAEEETLERYIINNEPSNQEILNQQYNKYYWNN